MLALNVALICLVLGYPVAYAINSTSPRTRRLFLIPVMLPYLTSVMVRTYAWMVLLGTTGIVNQFLVVFSLGPFKLINNSLGVYIGMVHVLLPLMILPVCNAMHDIDMRLVHAAEGLGATPLQAFVRVFVPLSLPGVAAGFCLVFIISLGFFMTPALLGALENMTVSMLIENQVGVALNWGFASALGVVLLLLTTTATIAGAMLVVKVASRAFAVGGVRLIGSVSVNAHRRAPLAVWIFAGLVLFFLVFPIFVVIPISFSAANYLQFPPKSLSLALVRGLFRRPWMGRRDAAELQGRHSRRSLVDNPGDGGRLRPGALRFSGQKGDLRRAAVADHRAFDHHRDRRLLPVRADAPRRQLVGSGALAYGDRHSPRRGRRHRVAERFQHRRWSAPPWVSARRPGSHLRRITLPLISPGIATAALLAFLASFDEVVVAIFLSGTDAVTLPKKIWEGVWLEITPVIAAASTIVIALYRRCCSWPSRCCGDDPRPSPAPLPLDSTETAFRLNGWRNHDHTYHAPGCLKTIAATAGLLAAPAFVRGQGFGQGNRRGSRRVARRQLRGSAEQVGVRAVRKGKRHQDAPDRVFGTIAGCRAGAHRQYRVGRYRHVEGGDAVAQQAGLHGKDRLRPDRQGGARGHTAGLIHPYGVPNILFSRGICYNTKAISPDQHPRSWAEVWDVKKFPGQRSLGAFSGSLTPDLEFALLADGVPMDKLYPLDIERSFKSLDRIRPNVAKFWTTGAMSPQMLTDGEISVGSAYINRIGDLIATGAPVAYEWNQANVQNNYWCILKGRQELRQRDEAGRLCHARQGAGRVSRRRR